MSSSNALLALAVSLVGCHVPQAPQVAREELRLRDIHMRVWRADRVVAQVEATELVLAGGGLTGLNVSGRTERGELTASRLEFDLRTMAARASGEVKGRVGGWSFAGSALRFRRDGVVQCDAPFSLDRGSVHHRGRAFEWDPVGAVAVLEQLSSVMDGDAGTLTLAADRVLYRETPRTADATGHVVVDARPSARARLVFWPGQEGVRVTSLEVE